MKHKKKLRRLIIVAIMGMVLCLVVVVLFYNGIILFNELSSRKYSVKGVDISSYQGDIDWNILAGQDIQFAFIKATEGSSYIDPYFQSNYVEAEKTNLRIGAYHFFSYDSSGKTQSENFISVVPKGENMLPPVVDVEFYGDKETNLPDKNEVHMEVSVLLNELEKYYGLKPIIYATEKSYRLYIAEEFQDYDIWIRNVFTKPTLSDKRDWTFWQYTNRECLNGYKGKEKYIDMNVFWGTQEDFSDYAKIDP